MQAVIGEAIRLGNQHLQCLCVKERSQILQGKIAVTDMDKHRRRLLRNGSKIYLIFVGKQLLYSAKAVIGEFLRQDGQDGAVGLVRFSSSLEKFPAHGRKAVRADGAILPHELIQDARLGLCKQFRHADQGVLLPGQVIQGVSNQGLRIISGREVPKRVRPGCDRHQCRRNSNNILLVPALPVSVPPDEPKRIISPGRVHEVGKIQLQHPEPPPLQNAAHLPPQTAFGVRDNKGFLTAQQIGHDIAPGLSAAGGADNQIMVGKARCPGVVAHCYAIRQNAIANISHALLLSNLSITSSASPNATASSAPYQLSLAVTR